MGNRRDRRSRRGVDPSAGIRALRLEQLFREELSSILEGELGDERFDGVRVTLVELSRDGSRARVWYSLSTDDRLARASAVEDAFERAAPYLRRRLCDALPLKRFPELSFRHDPAALSAFDETESSF
jgi:ribosome-binding factor A